MKKKIIKPLYVTTLSASDSGVLTLIVMESYKIASFTVYCVSYTWVRASVILSLVMNT